MYIGDDMVLTENMSSNCRNLITQATSPVFLDGVEAATGIAPPMQGEGYCPWCWKEIVSSDTYFYTTPVLCSECKKKYAAQYDANMLRVWLCGRLVCADVVREIGLRLINL
jgi:hypothetical protein